jgi:signal peptide peptidase SppA
MQHQLHGFYGRPWGVEKLILIEMESAVRASTGFAAAGPREPQPRNVRGGIAVLPLLGVIFQRTNLLTEFFGGTSLDRFARDFRLAVQNPGVSAIVLDVDSPGGEIFGTMEMAAEIFRARKEKKIIAIANSLMASAAYWIASAAAELVVTPSGQVGSIGVFALHMDFSKNLEMAGVKPTFISAGAFKTEGNELEPLGETARGALQKRINEYYDAFVRDVARQRGATPAQVRGGFGQGRVVGAAEARALGMVDRVATLDETLARLASGQNRSQTSSASARAHTANETARDRLRLLEIS